MPKVINYEKYGRIHKIKIRRVDAVPTESGDSQKIPSQNADHAQRDAKPKLDEEEKAWEAAHPEQYDYEEDLKIQLEKCEKLIGKKVRIPSSSVEYHNAIVQSVCEPIRNLLTGRIEDMKVQVTYTHPTTKKMLPCPDYLSDHCILSDEVCEYSHGEDVPVKSLGDYEEPQYELLAPRCLAKAKMPDGLWVLAQILSVDRDARKCRVRLCAKWRKNRERELPFEHLFPKPTDEEEKAWEAAHPEQYDYEEDLKIQKEKCEKLIGKKVRVPSSSVEYHNAIVQSVCDEPIRNLLTGRIEDMKVHVTYTHPTTKKMLPCPDYLNEHCILSDKDCEYSHGADVPVKSLGDYEEPQYELLAPRCLVNAKMPGGLWVLAQILSVDRDARKCRVRLCAKWSKNRERELPFEHLFPKPTVEYSSVGGYFTDPERSENEEEKAWEAAYPEQNDYEEDLKIQKEKCEKLIGKKVRVPSSSVEYHNAIVQSVCDEPIRNLLTGRIEDMKVHVTYTHPTTKKMLPCPDYLNEHCILSDKDCEYSHGADVPVKSLGDYEEPQYELLAPRCLAKAKMPGGLWVLAYILSVDRDARKCRVRLCAKWRKNRERELPFEHLFPKPTDEYSSVSGYFTDPERSEDSSESEESESSEIDVV